MSKTSPSKSKGKKSSPASFPSPPWTEMMRMAGAVSGQGPNLHHRNDDGETGHSLPLPEEARTTAAVADASNGGGGIKSVSKRRMMMIIGTVLSIALIVSLSIAIAAKRSDEGGSAAASAAKKMRGGVMGIRDPDLDLETNERFRNIVDFLGVYSYPEDLQSLDTPQNQAAKWLANIDGAMMDVPASSHYKDAFPFVQRYIIAVFYFALDGPNWKHDLDMMSPVDVCDWNSQREMTIRSTTSGASVQSTVRSVGVACGDHGQINYIYLPQNGLRGTLPNKELGLLEAMDHFSVVENQIEGALPESLSLWKDIRIFACEFNGISGPIPDYISSWTKLEYFSMGHNQFTGTIPALDQLTSLRDFEANDNQLVGPIDMFNGVTTLNKLNLANNGFNGEITDDTLRQHTLETLDLGGNHMSGSFPAHFYAIQTVALRENQLTGPLPAIEHTSYPIQFLSVFGNSLSGELPSNIGDLSQLTHLDVSQNGFTGRIPSASLDTLTDLTVLYLGDNAYDQHHFPYMHNLGNLRELSVRNSNLIGAIPKWVGISLVNMQLFDASNNHLNSTIPFELGDMETVRFLMLDHNELAGMMPTSFPNLRHLHILTLNHNALIGGMSTMCDDDMGPPGLDFVVTDCDMHSCECCKYCCEHGDATCQTNNFSDNIDNGYSRDTFEFPEGLSYNPHAHGNHHAGEDTSEFN